jgi:hypothetical protein
MQQLKVLQHPLRVRQDARRCSGPLHFFKTGAQDEAGFRYSTGVPYRSLKPRGADNT